MGELQGSLGGLEYRGMSRSQGKTLAPPLVCRLPPGLGARLRRLFSSDATQPEQPVVHDSNDSANPIAPGQLEGALGGVGDAFGGADVNNVTQKKAVQGDTKMADNQAILSALDLNDTNSATFMQISSGLDIIRSFFDPVQTPLNAKEYVEVVKIVKGLSGAISNPIAEPNWDSINAKEEEAEPGDQVVTVDDHFDEQASITDILKTINAAIADSS